MKNYFKEIQTRLNNEIELEDIVIIDNSSKHKGHKFFSPEKISPALKNKIIIFKLSIKNKCSKNNYESFRK